MINYDTERARRAVEFLANSSYIKLHARRLRSTVGKPRALPFKGEEETLNELLIIGRQNLQAMENLIEVAESKHGDRNEYQKEYMAAQRLRTRRLLFSLFGTDRGGAPAHVKQEAAKTQLKKWQKELDDCLAAVDLQREQDKRPSAEWLERNTMRRAFWEAVDYYLVEAVKAKRTDVTPPREYTTFVKPRYTDEEILLRQEMLDAMAEYAPSVDVQNLPQ